MAKKITRDERKKLAKEHLDLVARLVEVAVKLDMDKEDLLMSVNETFEETLEDQLGQA